MAGRLIRFLAAFVWLRWQLLLGALRGGARRDVVERLSRILAVLVPLALLLGVGGAATALGLAALAGGFALGSGGVERLPVLLAARGVLMVVTGVVLLGALSGPGQGSLTVTTRFRMLPIPARTLHLVEAASGLADPWLVYVVPALLLLPAGLLLGGRGTVAAVGLAAGLAFLALLAGAASAVSGLARWFLRNRARAETFTVAFVIAVSLLALVPAFLGDAVERELRASEHTGPQGIEAALPRWTRALPSELYGTALRAGLVGRQKDAWLAVAALLAQAGAVFALSAAAHRRALESGETGSPRRAGAPVARAVLRLPLLSAATSAVAVVQARTAWRTVRGRLVVLASAPVLLIFGVLARRMPDEVPGGAAFAHGDLLLGLGAIFGLYALQAFTMNQFGADRAGLGMQFLAPLTDLELVRGKAVGCGLVYGATLLLCLLCALAVAPGGSPLSWISVLLGAVATYVLLTPAAALLSSWLPVASDLTKTGSGGNPHGLAMLAGTVLVLVLAAPAAALVLVVGHLLERPALGLLLMTGWAALALAVSAPLLTLASRGLAVRRENLVLVAAGKG